MYFKPPTTFDEQLDKLVKRGCCVSDPVSAREALHRINYYRFSAYFLPFKTKSGEYSGTPTFNRIYRIYEFDRKLRGLLFGAIEEIELFLRTQLAYYHAHRYGATEYLNPDIWRDKERHEKLCRRIAEEISNNRNAAFVKHHIEQYDAILPIWAVVELFSFGMLSQFYSNMPRQNRKALASLLYGTTDPNLESWLRCASDLRNICAHYGRLYYKKFVAIPRKPDDLEIPLDNRSLFDNIIVVKLLYPDPSKWNYTFLPSLWNLIQEYHYDIDLAHIGFPPNWDFWIKK